MVSSIARAVAAICFQDVVMTKMMSAAAAAYLRYSEGFMTCVDIKVQAPFNSWSLAVGARCCSLDTVRDAAAAARYDDIIPIDGDDERVLI